MQLLGVPYRFRLQAAVIGLPLALGESATLQLCSRNHGSDGTGGSCRLLVECHKRRSYALSDSDIKRVWHPQGEIEAT